MEGTCRRSPALPCPPPCDEATIRQRQVTRRPLVTIVSLALLVGMRLARVPVSGSVRNFDSCGDGREIVTTGSACAVADDCPQEAGDCR